MLIVIEGCEGSGKTTQAKKIADWVQSTGKDVYRARFPGGTSVGEKIRDYLLHTDEEINKIAELLLYKADEAQHISIIKQKIKEDKWVVSDRFFYSTIAYQAYGKGIDIEFIHQLNRITSQDIFVDFLFVMDVDLKTGLERSIKASGRFDRYESLSLDFHKRVQEGFESLFTGINKPFILNNKWNYGLTGHTIKINANREESVVFDEIKNHITGKV